MHALHEGARHPAVTLTQPDLAREGVAVHQRSILQQQQQQSHVAVGSASGVTTLVLNEVL
jgi:hypothetical protein